MRYALPLVALALSTGAAPPEAGPAIRETVPAQPVPDAVCRDRIHEAREARGLQRLPDRPVSPDEPLFIAAVDQRVGGCSVLVMRSNTAEIRPLPTAPAGPARLMPAR